MYINIYITYVCVYVYTSSVPFKIVSRSSTPMPLLIINMPLFNDIWVSPYPKMPVARTCARSPTHRGTRTHTHACTHTHTHVQRLTYTHTHAHTQTSDAYTICSTAFPPPLEPIRSCRNSSCACCNACCSNLPPVAAVFLSPPSPSQSPECCEEAYSGNSI